MKKALVTNTAACCTSMADFNLIGSYLKRNGWALTRKIINADTIIIYTCACAKPREDLAAKTIKKALKEKGKNTQIIVTGCFPKINQSGLRKIFKGSSVSADYLEGLDKLLHSRYGIKEIAYIGSSGKEINKRDVYPLRIGWGCQGRCNYCATKFVFGKPRSRPIADILQEYDTAYRHGYRRFILAANDSGYYGLDLNSSLAELLGKLCPRNKKSLFMLSGGAIHKLKETLPTLKKFLQAGKFWRINMAVESGSQRMLRLMRRGYTVNDCKYCVQKLKEYAPDLEIAVNMMVGFPKETEGDFKKTLELVNCLGSYVNLFSCGSYSNRPNTLASRMAGQIDRKVVQNRLERLEKLCAFIYLFKEAKDKYTFPINLLSRSQTISLQNKAVCSRENL